MSVIVATAYMRPAISTCWFTDAGCVLANHAGTTAGAHRCRIAGGGVHRAAARSAPPRPCRRGDPLLAVDDGDAIEAEGPTMRLAIRCRGFGRLPHPPWRDLRLSGLQRLRQDDHDEDAHRPAASQRRPGLAVRPRGGSQGPGHPPPGRLHVAKLLAVRRTDRAPEPGIACAPVQRARRRDSWPRCRDGGPLRPGRGHRYPAGQPAAGCAPAPVAGGCDGAPARAADPDEPTRRGPGRPRCLLAPAADLRAATR